MDIYDTPSVKVAIVGCSHGELDQIYSTLTYRGGADLLIICGDFQSLRNKNDLNCISMPLKYKKLGDFHEYYSGKKKAEVLTIFVGGNHEASNYLGELFYGGWAAPNIYFLGKAGSVIFNGLRISGASGIFKQFDHGKGHFEKVPYNASTIKSVYHTRDYEIVKLNCLRNKPDIFISHDWPNNIEKYGNTNLLLKLKPFFRNEVQNNCLGSPAYEFLLNRLKPKYWFSAHLHVKFMAKVYHEGFANSNKRVSLQETEEKVEENRDEIDIDLNDLIAEKEEEEATIINNEIDMNIEEGIEGKLEVTPDVELVKEKEEGALEPNDSDVSNGTQPILCEEELKIQALKVNDEINNLNGAIATDVSLIKANDNDNKGALDIREEEYSPEVIKPTEAVKSNSTLSEVSNLQNSNSNPNSAMTTPKLNSKRPINPPETIYNKEEEQETTQFLALDKCLNKRKYLEILDIPITDLNLLNSLPRDELCYDIEWLAITKIFHPLLPQTSIVNINKHFPEPNRIDGLIRQACNEIRTKLGLNDDIVGFPIPMNFRAEAPSTLDGESCLPEYTVSYHNSQTQELCDLLELKNVFTPPPPSQQQQLQEEREQNVDEVEAYNNSDEIEI